MKTIKHITLLLLLMLTTTLSAQVIEVNSYGNWKYYMADVDSIVYVPAQDWSITASVDSYYKDSLSQEAHAVITITVGPDAHVARAGFGNIQEDSVPSIKLTAGTTQTIDIALSDKQNDNRFYLYTKNQYHSYYDYLTSISIDASALYWVDYGTALYREDLMTTFWGVENLVYEVPIQKNTLREGYYRLVNPYGAAYPYNDPGDWDDSVDSYLTINATDPDFVYVENSPTTTDWGYGAFTMTSFAAYYLGRGYSLETLKAQNPEYFGKLKDGVITMPDHSMLMAMADYNNGGLYYSNNNGLFAVALPGATLENYSARAADASIGTDKGNKAAMLKTDVRPAKVAGANMPKNMMKAPSGGAELIDAQSIQRSKEQNHLLRNGLK